MLQYKLNLAESFIKIITFRQKQGVRLPTCLWHHTKTVCQIDFILLLHDDFYPFGAVWMLLLVTFWAKTRPTPLHLETALYSKMRLYLLWTYVQRGLHL